MRKSIIVMFVAGAGFASPVWGQTVTVTATLETNSQEAVTITDQGICEVNGQVVECPVEVMPYDPSLVVEGMTMDEYRARKGEQK